MNISTKFDYIPETHRPDQLRMGSIKSVNKPRQDGDIVLPLAGIKNYKLTNTHNSVFILWY